MSAEERFGTRDLTYSRWHRNAVHKSCTAIDIDMLDYCQRCRAPLAIQESALDIGQDNKATTVTKRVAEGLNIPGFLVMVEQHSRAPHFVAGFRIKTLYPLESDLVEVEPAKFAGVLLELHQDHAEICPYRRFR